MQLMRMYMQKGHSWVNKRVKEVGIPRGSLALMIKRDKETIIPKGDTMILAGDTMILSVPPYVPSEDEKLEEIRIDSSCEWCRKKIGELKLEKDELIALIMRNNETIIPDGATTIMEGDIVVLYRSFMK